MKTDSITKLILMLLQASHTQIDDMTCVYHACARACVCNLNPFTAAVVSLENDNYKSAKFEILRRFCFLLAE